MHEFVGIVGPKGQITLPAEVRRRLGLRPKDRVQIRVEDDAVTIAPAPPGFLTGYQSIPALDPPRSLQEMSQIAAEEAAENAAREGFPP
jgi:AbrB family looped-hinge helix DNA binding protein